MTSKPQRPAHVLDRGLEAALVIAATFDDPVQRAQELALALGRMPDLQRRLRRARADAIREALAAPGASHESVADQLSVSVGRLHQLLDRT